MRFSRKTQLVKILNFILSRGHYLLYCWCPKVLLRKDYSDCCVNVTLTRWLFLFAGSERWRLNRCYFFWWRQRPWSLSFAHSVS